MRMMARRDPPEAFVRTCPPVLTHLQTKPMTCSTRYSPGELHRRISYIRLRGHYKMSVMLIALSIYMRMGQLGVNLLRSPLMRLPRYSMIMEVATMMRTLMMLLARKVVQPRKYALNSE